MRPPGATGMKPTAPRCTATGETHNGHACVDHVEPPLAESAGPMDGLRVPDRGPNRLTRAPQSAIGAPS
jgi:hypothetical protein